MKNTKEIGIIGLGKMGFRMAEHLIEQGYSIFANDVNEEAMKNIEEKGAKIFNSLQELVKNLQTPRNILIAVPLEHVDSVIDKLNKLLSKGDIVIESGNCFYKDSQIRAKKMLANGIYFLDAGVSGGISGARHGACLMIGGDKKAFEKTEDIFKALSEDSSYMYLGKSGSGHLVKGYHNLVEYGYLEALAEGLECINNISKKEGMNLSLKDVCGIWNKGSIVESRITRDAESAFKNNPKLEGISGSVFGQTQKEMEKLVKIAEEQGIRVPSCKAALDARIESQEKPTFAGKVINAIRNVFGGHKEWKKQ